MPYRDPEVRRDYNRRKGREHYLANRQHYIARSAARKCRLREERAMSRQATQAKEPPVSQPQPCPKCGKPMRYEEMGGRRYWGCESGACDGRILLDPPNPHYQPKQDALEILEAPGVRRGRGRPPLSERARLKISQGVQARHARAAQAKEPPVSQEAALLPQPSPAPRPTAPAPTGALDVIRQEIRAREVTMTRIQGEIDALRQALGILTPRSAA
jgi:hypothetical protein